MIDEDEEQKSILGFYAYAYAPGTYTPRPGVGVERPVWKNRIDVGLIEAFEHGGYARLSLIQATDNAYVRNLTMNALPGQFRLTVLTNDPDYKNEVLEWWEPGDKPFRGKILFGDDEWDARTVCTDLEVAIRIFRDMFDHGDLSKASLFEMRSPWNPKP